MKDLVVAARGLAKAPVFAVVAVISLALAIGPNSAIFALVDAVLLRPLPAIEQPERLVSIYHRNAADTQAFQPLSWPEFEAYRRNAHVFSDVLAYLRIPLAVRFGERTESIPAELVSPNYLRTLGVRLRLGRDFTTEGTERAVVLSERLWRERFGADPRLLGRTIQVGSGMFTVVGVAPAAFRGVVLDWGAQPQMWIPAQWYREAMPLFGAVDVMHEWGMRSFVVTARLAAGVGVAQASAEVESVGRALDAEHPQRGTWVTSAMPLGRARFWPGFRSQIVTVLAVLMAVALCVLLIACANVAALVLTRAAQREREIGVRIALGAGAGAVLRLLLAESFLLTLGGCAAGVATGVVLTRALSRFPKILAVPLSVDLTLDWRVAAFCALLGLTVTVFVGVAPLRQCLAADLASAFRATGPAGRKGRRIWNLRGVLAAAQVALSFALVVQAGLFLRTFRNASESDSFLQAGNLLIARVEVTRPEQAVAARAALAADLVERARALPGVEDALLASILPMSGMRAQAQLELPGAEPVENTFEVNAVSPAFLKLAGAALRQGRGFTEMDRADRPAVAVVNQQMAERYWHGDAVGRQIREKGRLVTVVGVVNDPIRRTYRAEVPPRVYFPIAQRSAGAMYLVVKAREHPLPLVGPLRDVVARLAPAAVLADPQTLAEYTSSSLAQERLAAWCLGALASLALVLSLVGIYGTVAFSVAQRRGEIGIRMALGSSGAGIVRAMLRPVAVVSGTGLLAGAGLCALAAPWAEPLLYGVAWSDGSTWSVAGVVLAATALLAAAVPALVASRIDPAVVLRGN